VQLRRKEDWRKRQDEKKFNLSGKKGFSKRRAKNKGEEAPRKKGEEA